MNEESPIQLVTTKPDAEIAAELKARAGEAIKPFLALCDEAMAKNLRIQFDGVAVNMLTMRFEMIGLRIVKIY